MHLIWAPWNSGYRNPFTAPGAKSTISRFTGSFLLGGGNALFYPFGTNKVDERFCSL